MLRPRILLATVCSLSWFSASQATPVVVYDSLSRNGQNDARFDSNYVDPSDGSRVVTTRFGDAVSLLATGSLTTITVALSNAALKTSYPSQGTASGYSVPMTFSLYNVADNSADPAVGSLIATRSATAAVAWRPAADTTGYCNNGDFKAGDGTGSACYSASTSYVTFDFSNVVLQNARLIFGLSFDASSGAASKLGFGLSVRTYVGTDLDADGAEWAYKATDPNTRTTTTTGFAPDHGDGYYAAVGNPALRIEMETPVTYVVEPGSWMMLATAFPLVGALRRRAKRRG